MSEHNLLCKRNRLHRIKELMGLAKVYLRKASRVAANAAPRNTVGRYKVR